MNEFAVSDCIVFSNRVKQIPMDCVAKTKKKYIIYSARMLDQGGSILQESTFNHTVTTYLSIRSRARTFYVSSARVVGRARHA